MKQLFTILLLLLVISCSPKKEDGEKESPKPDVKQEKKENLPIVVAREVKKSDLKEYIVISGKLQGVESVQMVSQTQGKLIKLYKSLGDWVNKDASIGEVENKVIKIRLQQQQAFLQAADASFAVAKQNMSATQQLYDAGEVSKAEYDRQVAEFTNALANQQSARLALQQSEDDYSYSLLKAPIGGYITDIPIDVGEFISAGKYICKIVNSKKLKIRTGVSQSEIGKIRKGQSVVITHKDKEYEAELTGFGKALAAYSFSYPVEIKLENDGTLFAGMIVNVKILANTYEDVIKISNNYILNEYGQKSVFVVQDNSTISKRAVEISRQIEGVSIVESGLNEGDVVIESDVEQLSDKMAVEVKVVE